MTFKPFLLPLIALVTPAFAMDGWMSNIDKAMELAQKENKLVLVEFTGSDWCPPCKALKKEVFPSPEFKEITDKNLIPVELDFPRKSELPAEQKQYNGEMAKKYGITVYPTVYLLNPDGKTVWLRIGGGTKEQYLEDLKQGVANSKLLIETQSKLEKVEGKEKLELLDKAWQMMSRDLKKKNQDILKEIIALDKADTLGYAKEEQKRLEIEKQEEELREVYRTKVFPLSREGKTDEAIAELKKLANREDLLPQAKQSVYMSAMYGICMDNSDMPAAIQALKDAIKIDPSTDRAKNCEYLIKYLDANKEEFLKRMAEKKAQMEKMQQTVKKKQ